jgi:diguanylate cyclase (GGDEF)-like protein
MADNIYELEQKIAGADCVQTKIGLLNTLAAMVEPNDPARCMEIVSQATGLADVANDLEGRAEAENIAGRLYIRQGQFDQALLHYTRALTAYEQIGHHERIASVLMSVGFIHYSIGNYAMAQEHFLKSIDFAHGFSLVQEAYAWNNAACACIGIQDHSTALGYLLKSLELARESQDAMPLATTLDTLADLYLKISEPEIGLEYALQSVEIGQKSNLDFDRQQGASYTTLGKVYLALKDYPNALLNFQTAAQTFGSNRVNHRVANAILMTGVTLRMQGHFAASLEALNQARGYAEEIGIRPVCAEALLEVSRTYKELGDYRQALDCFEQYHALKETVFNERADNHFRTIQVVHQVESSRKEAELTRLRNVELQHEIDEREKAQAALIELATRDSLTGLFNRRHFYTLAEQQLSQAIEHARPLALILFDIDHFKQVNDTYGHLVGDKLLKIIAKTMLGELRPGDQAARYAGDEFVILAPETDSYNTVRLAEQIRNRIANQPIDIGAISIPVTISVGISALTPGVRMIEQIIEQADQALYSAKKAGRNRVQPFTTLAT